MSDGLTYELAELQQVCAQFEHEEQQRNRDLLAALQRQYDEAKACLARLREERECDPTLN